jgi:hypothetical protein
MSISCSHSLLQITRSVGLAFLLLSTAVAGQEPKTLVIDSGWAATLPTIRSASVVGQDAIVLFERGYGDNTVSNLALATLETFVAWQYITCLHELGHADIVKAKGDRPRFENNDTSWWSYLIGHKPLTEAAVYCDQASVGYFAFYAAGFNASTYFAEHTKITNYSSLTFVLPARFSTFLYVLSPQPGALDDTRNMSAHYRAQGRTIGPADMRRWQAASFCASASTWAVVRSLFGKKTSATSRWTSPDFFTYLNPDGISLRATDTVALSEKLPLELAYEAVVQGRFRHEIELGTRFPVASRISLQPRVLLSDHGSGGELRVEYVGDKIDLVIGCRLLDPSTLVGAREGRSLTRTTTEGYAQLRLMAF